MTDMEIQLRGAMDDLAADAPSSDGLLDAVHRRGRTAHRRRVLAGVAAVAAVALVGGLAVTTLTGRDEATERLRVATPGPSPSENAGSASPRPAGKAPKAPPAPVGVGWLPGGFPEPTVRMLGPGAWGLDTRRKEGLAALQVQVMAAKPAVRTAPGTLSDVDLAGLPGQLYWVPTHPAGDPRWGHSPPEAEGPYAELTFARKPGQWIRIIIQNSAGDVDLGITQEDLVKIATSLVDQDRAVPDAIRVGALPDGFAWGALTNDEHGVSAGFLDAGAERKAVSQDEQPNGHNGSVPTTLRVSILPVDSLDLSFYLPGQERLAPGKEADIPEGTTVSRGDGVTYAVTRLASNPKLVVAVQAQDSLKIPEANLRALAETTEIGPDAVVKPMR